MNFSDRARRLAVPLAAFLGGLTALAVAAVLTLTPAAQAPGGGIGGAFTLQAHDGRTLTEKDVLGRPYLVFFGFTHCPDVCPTKLFELSEVLRAAGDKGRDLRALFITVDPERDTPEVLKSYVASFDERILGLGGDPGAVESAVRAFKAYARKVPGTNGEYTMEHTAHVYLMDKRGRFAGTFNLNRPPDQAAAEILRLL